MQKTKKGLTNKKSCDIIFKSNEISTQPIFSRGIFPSRDEYDNIVGNADSYMALWPSGKAKVCNTSIPGSIPGGASNERSNPTGLLFSFVGGATLSSNRALRALRAQQNPARIRRSFVADDQWSPLRSKNGFAKNSFNILHSVPKYAIITPERRWIYEGA